jgi:predicted branched-subunit amino acid permease
VREEAVAGAKAVAPMLVGVIPFGLVAGATPATTELGGGVAIGLSTIVFAGASQLAAADVLADGGSALVAVVAACTINLRMLLYSASVAPFLAKERWTTRMGIAYLLTDQAYAVSITRWSEPEDAALSAAGVRHRVAYIVGAGLTLWTSWQISTLVGIAIGSRVPESLPLDFAVPLVFLVLLVPAVNSRPAAVAATAGGASAVLAAELGAGTLSIIVGAVCGIAAGTVAELVSDGRSSVPGQ